METLLSCAQILVALATLGSLFFVMRQTRAMERSNRYTSDWQEKNKAVELAAYYEREILPRIDFLTVVFKRVGVVEALRRIKVSEIKEFTQQELFDLTGPKISEEVTALMQDEKNAQMILDTMKTYFLVKPAAYADFTQLFFSEAEAKKASSLSPLVSSKVTEYISTTLNKLEQFAMCFTTGVADGDVVYQSLHQTYLSCIRAVYFYIANTNTHPKDKYFTNAIELYCEWMKKDAENMKNMERAVARANKVRKK